MAATEFGYSQEYIDSIKPMNIGWEPFHDGVYWQPQTSGIVHHRRQLNHSLLRHRSVGEMRLRQYQDFAELDWLRPHGHFLTVLAMERHLIGEYHELHEASMNLPFGFYDERKEKLLDTNMHAVVSEQGDILWFMNALATNGGLDTEEAWRFQRRIGQQPTLPTLRSIDDMIVQGYVPNIGAFELEEDVVHDILYALGFLSIGVRQILESNTDSSRYDTQAKQLDVSRWLAQGIGLIAFHAHQIGSSLSEVAEENIKKISMRAERGTLDKKEARSAEEL